jgi:hypothetical protein
MSLLSRRAGRALSLAFFPLAAAALFGAGVPEAEAVPPCWGGTSIYSGGTLVGCMFPSWGPSEKSMCNGAVYIPPEYPEGCHICVVPPLDPYVLDPNKWSIFTPSDFSCRLDTPSEGGWCEDGRYCDANGCQEHDSPFSVAMCQCKLLDPACGIGECVGNAYCEGGSCDFPVCYSPDTDISKALCGGYSLNPPECKAEGCQPHTDHYTAGVADDFSASNGPELPAPSGTLLDYIASIYAYPGSRDFDAIGGDRWFGHTFSGLQPESGEYICGARLITRIGHGQTGLNNNDSLGLFFLGPDGTVGSSYGAALTDFGINNGSSALITLDLANLPGGLNLLPEIAQNGWIDYVVQDDHAVDFARLEIDYCCEGNDDGGGQPPVDPQPSPGDVPVPADTPVAVGGPATLELAPAASDLGD